MTRLTCFRRKVLLGRNLITLFSGVNSFGKKSDADGRPRTSTDAPARKRMRAHIDRAHAIDDAKREKKSAFFPKIFRMRCAKACRAGRARTSRSTRTRRPGRHKPELTRPRKKVPGFGVAQRPRSPICANFAPPRLPPGRCRRHPNDADAQRAHDAPARKNPRLATRVS